MNKTRSRAVNPLDKIGCHIISQLHTNFGSWSDGGRSTISQMTYILNFSFLYLIWRCKEPSCPWSSGWSCGRLCRFLTGVSVPDHDGDWFTMSQSTYVSKFSFLHWIIKCKEPSCPWSSGLGIWRTLEVPDWDFGSWSWWMGLKSSKLPIFQNAAFCIE